MFSFSYGFRAKILCTLGKSSKLRDVMDALLADNLVQRGFTAKVLAEAAEAAEFASRRDSYRADLRDLFTFTVDPALAHDFDDALSFERSDGGATVYVHIADVSYYVLEETALDREALRRGNSVYVATGVEPMLPPLLSSNGLLAAAGAGPQGGDRGDGGGRRAAGCSSPGSTDHSSAATNVWTTRSSSVSSAARNRPRASWRRVLEVGRPLVQTLRDSRAQRGSLRIDSPEPEFEWDAAGAVSGR